MRAVLWFLGLNSLKFSLSSVQNTGHGHVKACIFDFDLFHWCFSKENCIYRGKMGKNGKNRRLKIDDFNDIWWKYGFTYLKILQNCQIDPYGILTCPSDFSLFSNIRSTSLSFVEMLAGSSNWHRSISRTKTSLGSKVCRSSRIFRNRFLKGRKRDGKSLWLRSTLRGPSQHIKRP